MRMPSILPLNPSRRQVLSDATHRILSKTKIGFFLHLAQFLLEYCSHTRFRLTRIRRSERGRERCTCFRKRKCKETWSARGSRRETFLLGLEDAHGRCHAAEELNKKIQPRQEEHNMQIPSWRSWRLGEVGVESGSRRSCKTCGTNPMGIAKN